MKTNKNPPGTALVRTVVGRELGDVVFDAIEVALDQVLTDGVLKELPIIGTVVKLARARQSIAEELFLRMLLRFLRELQSIPAEERSMLLERYPDGSEEQRILGENLLLALERLDDVQKPTMLARFFVAFIEEKIDYATFSRLAQALERFNLALIPQLRWFYTREGPTIEMSEEIEHELSLAGLLTVGLAGSGAVGGGAGYYQSSIGRLFLKFGLGVHTSQ